MSYITYLMADCQGILSVLSNIFGIAGFLFGMWRYFRERQVQAALKDRQAKLNDTLARLSHLKNLAAGVDKYSAAV
jgi:hypothetical protein